MAHGVEPDSFSKKPILFNATVKRKGIRLLGKRLGKEVEVRVMGKCHAHLP